MSRSRKRARKTSRKSEKEQREREEKILAQVKAYGRVPAMPPCQWHKSRPDRDARRMRKADRIEARDYTKQDRE